MSELERLKTLVDEDATMSTSSSGETVTQENVDSTPSAEPQAEVKASLEQRKAKALSLRTSSRKLVSTDNITANYTSSDYFCSQSFTIYIPS